MQVWLLKLKAGRGSTLDCAEGFVVVAPSERRARELASGEPGDEGAAAWLDEAQSTCAPLILPRMSARVVLRAFNAG